MERLNFLFDKSANLLETAELQQQKVAALIEEFKLSSDKLDITATQIDKTVKYSLERNIDIASDLIIERVLNGLAEANKEAEKAASKYSSVAKLTALKLFSIFALFFTIAGTVFWFLVVENIPTTQEVDALRLERDALKQEVLKLKQYEVITNCNGQPCIRVDDKERFTSKTDSSKVYYSIQPKSE